MANFALWPNRANYHRFREMMQDGDKLPRSFGRWQRIAIEQIAQAQAEGNTVEIVPFNPEKFLAFWDASEWPPCRCISDAISLLRTGRLPVGRLTCRWISRFGCRCQRRNSLEVRGSCTNNCK